jgi:histidine ammonia-lyase
VSYRGQVISALQALSEEGLSPVELGAKDGLCLVNGTPCMTGLGCLAIADVNRLMQWADVIGAMTFEGCAANWTRSTKPSSRSSRILACSKWARTCAVCWQAVKCSPTVKGIRTQDALSIRSIPQVHGATRDQLAHATRQIETELNSATDNPLLLGTPEAYRVVSQANPHGQSVAMAADLLAIAMAELGSIAERRLDRLINPTVSGLPAFLVSQPGVNSGMMIVQYVAASLCAENRQMAQPAVIDNYVTSGLQEDHLSMGTSAALKLHKVLENVTQILAIEYLLAAQAFEFFKGPRFGVGTEAAWRLLRERVPAYDEDRWLAPDIASSVTLLKNEESLETVFQRLPRSCGSVSHNSISNSRSSSATSAGQAGASSEARDPHRRRSSSIVTDTQKATPLNLIPGQLTLAQLRAIYRQPVTLTLDASANRQIDRQRGLRRTDPGREPHRVRHQHRLRPAGLHAHRQRRPGKPPALAGAVPRCRRRSADQQTSWCA